MREWPTMRLDLDRNHCMKCAIEYGTAQDARCEALEDQLREAADRIAELEARIRDYERVLMPAMTAHDHFTACDSTMGASHPCTCGLDALRAELKQRGILK